MISDGKIGAEEQVADGVDERLRQRSSFSVLVIIVVRHGLRSRRSVATSGNGGPEESPPFGVFEDVRQNARQNPHAIHHNLPIEEMERDETMERDIMS